MMGALAVGGKLQINKKYNKNYNIEVSRISSTGENFIFSYDGAVSLR